VARLSAQDLYDGAIAAGFTPAQARTMAEIELAESGGNLTALGDVGLEDATWGPSYGVAQVRTLKRQTGTGGVRDISYLAGGLGNQDAAAYEISRHGADFSPWTTYRTGAYTRYAAQLAAVAPPAPGGIVDVGGVAVPVAAGGGGGLVGEILTGARGLVIEAVLAGAGLALLGLGISRLAAPRIKAKKMETEQAIGKLL
jgi:hypothetical protein